MLNKEYAQPEERKSQMQLTERHIIKSTEHRFAQIDEIEIKEFRGVSPIADLEQALGQYILYRLLLGQVDPERIIYLAVSTLAYNGIFSEPIGELAITEIPLNLVVIDFKKIEVQQWIT